MPSEITGSWERQSSFQLWPSLLPCSSVPALLKERDPKLLSAVELPEAFMQMKSATLKEGSVIKYDRTCEWGGCDADHDSYKFLKQLLRQWKHLPPMVAQRCISRYTTGRAASALPALQLCWCFPLSQHTRKLRQGQLPFTGSVLQHGQYKHLVQNTQYLYCVVEMLCSSHETVKAIGFFSCYSKD